ncbi:dephospho-CoA kinase [Reichenbachiella versicolor]|uniref:dephospho-CoA kinase n=1 Tax=Reichenbachiella versicolor TaxID=1821036 RepID=UPI000D6E535E|nr:dephospho-CoA kinase [Reichenbachiella versicolor]
MKKVGLTGGIGSGKSTIAKVFNLLGIPIYYADDRAKLLMNSSLEIKHAIISAFGVESYIDEELNRTHLAQQIFNSEDNIRIINSIVHPVVKEDFNQWANSQRAPYVLQEAALLVDNGSYKNFNSLISISVSEKARKDRTIKRDTFRSEEQVQQIIDKQVSEEARVSVADYVIYNEDSNLIIPQVLQIHEKLIK